MPSPCLVSALVLFLQPCYVIQSGINTVLTEAMTKLCIQRRCIQTLCIQSGTELHPVQSLGRSLDMEEVKQWECGTQEYPALEQRPIILNSLHPDVLLTVGV